MTVTQPLFDFAFVVYGQKMWHDSERIMLTD
jgi:hypothetical protein